MATRKGFIRLLQNSSLLFILNFTVRVSSSLLFLLLTRYRTSTEAGVFTLAISYTLIIEALSLWGLDQLLIRDTAHERERVNEIFPLYSSLRMILSIVGVLGFSLFAVWTDAYPSDMKLIIFVIVLTVLTEGFNDICIALSVALDLVRVPAIIGVAVSFLRMGLASFVILQSQSLLFLAFILLVLSALQAVSYGLFLRRHQISLRFNFDWQALKHLFRIAFPLGIINLLWALDAQGGSILLSFAFTPAIVTLYGIATTITTALVLLPQAAQMAVFPVLTRLYRTDLEQFKYWYKQLYTYLGALGLGIALFILGAAPGIVHIFGAYREAIEPLRILGWTLVFYFLTIPNSRAMILANRLWTLVYLLFISLCINWLLIIVLMNWLGVSAVAIARVVSLGTFFSLNHLAVRRTLGRVALSHILWRPLLAVALALGSWSLVINSHWIIQTSVIIGTYLFSLGSLQFHRRKELKRLIALLRKRSYTEPQHTVE